MVPLSVLDLAPVPQGSSPGEALRNSADLARHVEGLGFKRFWMAEHHNMEGIASAATAVALAHVAAATDKIRIGAGGVMLPNHAPLVIAEQFGTLAALHPGRVDLGLGRAPGTDGGTAYALRHNLGGSDDFPQSVVELINYFKGSPDARVRAFPGQGEDVPIWILGSSLYGAQLAAMLGLPYAFASHFAPAEMESASRIYRERFEPSDQLDRPHLMLALNVFAAPTDAEARLLFSSLQQAFVNLRTGRPGKLPPPVENFEAQLDPQDRAMLRHSLSCTVVGDPDTVKAGVEEFAARTGADELMVTAQIFDHEARKRSFTILAETQGRTAKAA